MSLLELKGWLFAHSTLRLSALFTFTIDELVEAYPGGVNDDVLRRVLNDWTFSFGDLKDNDPEHFFIGNPIWRRPIISLCDDIYFWPIIGLALSFCFELIESVIVHDNVTYDRYEKRRGRFLEDETERLFRKAFPFARFYRGSIWQDPTSGIDYYENDLLVLVDSYLIVVEAKSGKVTPPAKRGAEGSLRQTIKKLLVEPSEQGNRFAEFLRKNPGSHRFSTMRGTINEVDTSGVYDVIRLNVTLESLGALSSRWPEPCR